MRKCVLGWPPAPGFSSYSNWNTDSWLWDLERAVYMTGRGVLTVGRGAGGGGGTLWSPNGQPVGQWIKFKKDDGRKLVFVPVCPPLFLLFPHAALTFYLTSPVSILTLTVRGSTKVDPRTVRVKIFLMFAHPWHMYSNEAKGLFSIWNHHKCLS